MKKISILMGLILAAVFLLGNVTKKAIQYNYIHDEDESGDIIGQETLKYM